MSEGLAQGRSGNGIPDPDRLIERGRGDAPPIGTERHPVYRLVVQKWRGEWPAGGCIPDPGGLVEACGGNSGTHRD